MKFSVNETQIAPNYPYGRLRTEARFSVEFLPKKGFRSVFQTVNPKNNRENAPKKGTYHHFLYMTNVDGFISWYSMDFRCVKDVVKGLEIIVNHFDEFALTEEQIKYILNSMFHSIVIDLAYMKEDERKSVNDYLNVRQKLIEGMKEGKNVFPELYNLLTIS